MLPDAGVVGRTAGILKIGLTQHRNNEEMITLRCDRGAHILRKLGFGDDAAEAVRGLDEHWDGSGYPERRMGNTIPLESRILAVAQHLDVFASERGTDEAMKVLRERSGRWFDPELVRAAEGLHRDGSLWREALRDTPEDETRGAALELGPDTDRNFESRRHRSYLRSIRRRGGREVHFYLPALIGSDRRGGQYRAGAWIERRAHATGEPRGLAA